MPRAVKGPDGVLHSFPDDATDAEISAALGALPPSAKATAKVRTWADAAVDLLPAAGGAVGSIVGGIGGTAFGFGVGGVPGAIGGAGLGGAAGEAAKQLINRARGAEVAQPTTPLEAATGIGREGAIQAASEVAGQGLMKGAGMAAHGLMDFAIRPAPNVAKEFGDIAGTALRERVPVGSILPSGVKGSTTARLARGRSAQTTQDLLQVATRMGATIDPVAMAAPPVMELATNIAKQPLSEGELKWLSHKFMAFIDKYPNPLTPTAIKEMKTAAQGIAAPIFKALKTGQVVPAGQQLAAQFNKAVADGAKAALEALPKGAEIAASEARTQGLIGATKAIRQAEVRRLPLVAELAAPLAGAAVGSVSGGKAGVGEGVGTAILVRALLSPRTTSRMALGLTTPAIEQILRQMPRASVVALLESAGEEP